MIKVHIKIGKRILQAVYDNDYGELEHLIQNWKEHDLLNYANERKERKAF